ncbi:MAG: PorP/SprF family type IX secretion system membrane protein [Saprospiraceae bacterium]|nr:PorP/SprF family type IX secretion system membrane protein [Saprospiraceae bacterium]
MLPRLLLVSVIISFLSFHAGAQDPFFSQSYAAPLTINPALSGVFNGKLRVSAIYRDQGRQVLESPFVTFATGLDLRFKASKYGKGYKDYAGVGLLFISDRVPGLDYTSNGILVSGAYHKALDSGNKQYLSIGFQGGVRQRNISYNNLAFSDQFNGTTGYTDISAEKLPPNNYAYGDFSWGLNYQASSRNGTAFLLGFAMHHFLKANNSFYTPIDEQGIWPNNELIVKYTINASLTLPLGDKVQFLPRAVAQLQGPHFMADAGASFRFLLSEYAGTALHLGGWARPVLNEDNNVNLNAIVTLLGFEYQNVLFGLSYDISTTPLVAGRQGRSAFEFSIAYLGDYDTESVVCPKF